MTNITISQLNNAAALSSTDVFPLVQGMPASPTTVKVSYGTLFTNTNLTTPILGTPQSGNLSNCTNLSITAGTTGTLSVARGGTGVTSSTGTGNVVLSTSPTLVTPVLGAAAATSINKLAITAPATSATLTIADGKTATVNATLTFTGTDGTTMTFPTTNATIARTDAANTFTGAQAFVSVITTSTAAPTIASAATIAPTTMIVFVSGTTNIDTITPPTGIATSGGSIVIIPTGLWSTTTAGNIALATTAVVSRALTMTYDATTTKWYPSY
jgi:hypothetical protein